MFLLVYPWLDLYKLLLTTHPFFTLNLHIANLRTDIPLFTYCVLGSRKHCNPSIIKSWLRRRFCAMFWGRRWGWGWPVWGGWFGWPGWGWRRWWW